jgi:hypothetical protein
MGVLIGSLVLSVVIWIGGAIVRRRFGRSLDMSGGAARLRTASRVGALVLLAMFTGWGVLFAQLTAGGSGAIDNTLIALYVVGALAVIGAVVIIVEAALRVVRGPGGWLVRGGEIILGVSALYAIWAIIIYGLANFSLTY